MASRPIRVERRTPPVVTEVRRAALAARLSGVDSAIQRSSAGKTGAGAKPVRA